MNTNDTDTPKEPVKTKDLLDRLPPVSGYVGGGMAGISGNRTGALMQGIKIRRNSARTVPPLDLTPPNAQRTE